MKALAAIALVTALVGAGAAGARPVDRLDAPVIDAEAPDCQQIPPESTPPLATDVSEVLPLEARILIEPGDRPTAEALLETTVDAFARIGIRLKLSYQEVRVPAWGDAEDLGGPTQAEILRFMKQTVGGRRPKGTDLVYFMTRHWDGGFADCIGGVRYADRAFALGSIDYAIEGIVPSPTAHEGVIAAHELGHLLGAHHHYSNCAEALPSGAVRAEVNPCTTMAPLATVASSTFGVVERSFIRAYVAEYAKG